MSMTRPEGALIVDRIPKIDRPVIRNVEDAIRHGAPWPHGNSAPRQSLYQRKNSSNFERSIRDQAAFDRRELFAIGHLWLAKIDRYGEIFDYGLVSCRVVTNAGVQYIVDAFQNLVELENMKYHGIGTGTTAETATQTALVTELTTQYSTSNTRPSGSTGEQSGNANVFETSATITVSASSSVTEHGIFSQAAVGGGVMLDRSVFSPVNLSAGESLQTTYSLSFPSGG